MENQKLSTRALSLPPSLSHINTPKMEKGGHSSTINIEGELTRREMKGKAPLLGGGEEAKGGYKRGIAIFDFVLRVCGIAAALTATITMGTTDQTLPFFTQFLQFQASYDDLPTFTFFVIVNAIASAYLVLSVPFSIVCIVRPQAVRPRLLLFIFDTAIVALTTAAASSAAAIVYLAHNGNPSANWLAICQQFTDFCQSVSGAVVASFISVVIFMFLILLSAFALNLKRRIYK